MSDLKVAFDKKVEELSAAYDLAKSQADGSGKLIPKYSTGARSFIKFAGKPLGVAQSVQWQVQAPATEIRTIDTNLPWDMIPGQISIAGSLSQIIDPMESLESQGLFHTVQSMIHQPYMEMQILDASGQSLFFVRGMFTGMNGSIAIGQMSRWGCNFQGVLFQHNVVQAFEPYPTGILSSVTDAINNALGTLKSKGGGFP